MRIIGLTGSVGSGKTEVSTYLKKKGALIIDADSIGHRLLKPGNPVYQKLVETFGDTILGENREINRKALAEIIFSDEEKRRLLNGIMHPPMTSIIKKEIKAAGKSGKYPAIVLEAAILRESPWLALVTEVWVISASFESCLNRLINKGFTPLEAKKRLQAQLEQPKVPPSMTKYIINNNHSLEETLKKIDHLWGKISDEIIF
ncbi:MAG: Dephospho-CoA kinase [candidate division WS2 bacterium]|uniref:Dephospho-CoA kinase n=1 Tax=Psychracetigena formicireducens TaxID=2986056 RepID=A0A9E2BF41_PSYF1|nr:Dephospho-CoA kinase [Candidatus Psychracetigena formicireducens]MBT9144443.1 Dephospho-CoA kinase [Candidatus Psychracetigena formicireducens]